MAWNDKKSWGGRNNNYPSNNNGGYNRNYSKSDKPLKKSGCKAGTNKNGNLYVSGWNKSRSRGYITFIAFPYHSTSVYTSGTGKEWENWMIKITAGVDTILKPCLYERSTGRVICKELGLVANPKTNYFGTMFRKK
jgi:hypothetical protein